MTSTPEVFDVPEAANSNRKAQAFSIPAFLSQFSRDFLEKLPASEKNVLIEEAMTKDALAGTAVEKKIQEFRASDEKYASVKLEEIDIFMVRKNIAKGYLKNVQTRSLFQEKVLQQYDVSPQDYEQKIAPTLKDKDSKYIEKLLGQESVRLSFLKQQLGVQKVPERIKTQLISSLSPTEMQNRVRKMPESEKKDIGELLKKLEKGIVPKSFEIVDILKSSLLKGAEKIEFVQTFIPFISLEQALELGLQSESWAQNYKKEFVEAQLERLNIDDANAQEIEKQISFGDILLPTSTLVQSEEQAVQVGESVGFQSFVSDYQNDIQSSLQKSQEGGPQSWENLKNILNAKGGQGRVLNIELFEKGNIVKFSKKLSSGGSENAYIQIVDYDDEKKSFRFQNLGIDSINLQYPDSPQDISYVKFLENFSQNTSTSLECMTEDFVQDSIAKGNITSGDLQTLRPQYFEGEKYASRRNDIRQKEQEYIESQIASLKSKVESEKDASQKAKFEQDIKDLEKYGEKLSGLDISSDFAAELYNKHELLSKLDQIDAEGSSLGLGKGVTIYVGEKDDINTYTILDVNYEDWNITLSSRANLSEKIDLSVFYEEFKKKKKGKRVASIVSEQALVSIFGEEYEYSDGGIIHKNADLNGKKEDRQVEYLHSGENLIRIVSLGNGKVKFQQGEIKQEKDDHGHGHGHHHGPKAEKYSLKIEGADVQEWTLDEFHRYIKEEEYQADWKTGKNLEIHPSDPKNKTHGSLVDKFFKGVSLYELIHGGHMVFEGIKETLEHGSHAKSAHAALSFAKWLPGELKDEMYMKVEAAEAEETENAKKKLGAIDSWMAVKRIEKWLLNRDTPQYKLEAGALFMMEKYGHLTAKKSGEGKDGLYQYRGKFLWYERLGGHIGDELYNQVKADAKKDNQSFSEEKLVHMLLKQQCNSERHHYSGIHRRSRVHKEFENAWKSGIDGEFEKGEKDASAFRGSRKMVEEGMGEAKGGTTSNAFGWAFKAAKKGTGKPADYMHIPAAILLSGACFDIDQATYTRVKGYWDGEGIPVAAFRMFGNAGTMNLFRDTVLELAKEIQSAGYGDDYKNILSDTRKIYESGKSRSEKEELRLNEASKYWDKYGEVLTRALNFSLESDSKFGATDTVIKRKRKENSTYAEYYNLMRAATGEGDAFKDEYVDDWVGDTGFFGINPHDMILKHMNFDQGGGFRKKSIGPKVWNRFVDDINATKNKVLVAGTALDSLANRNAQKEYIAELLEEIVGTFYEMSGQIDRYIYGLNSETSLVGREFNKWGLNLQEDIGAMSAPDIIAGKKHDIFLKVAQNIISGNTGTGKKYDTPDILQVKKNTQSGVNANLSQKPEWYEAG